MATKIIPRKVNDREEVVVKTDKTKKPTGSGGQSFRWWRAQSKKDLCEQLISTVSFLKEQQQYRTRQTGIFARLYGNVPLFGSLGSSSIARMATNQQLPIDRPTMNVIQSCVDTLVSRISQARPRPVFLSDNADYKERNLAKQMNTFINGELYQTAATEKAPIMLRDAAVLGDGILKIYRTYDDKVGLDRVLPIELYVDPNDAMYGNPRQLFHVKLVDKSVMAELCPEAKSTINNAEQAFPETNDAQKTISDQVMIVEGWHLPSGKDAGDGRHTIACSAGVIFDETYKREKFPFVMLPYSPRLMGFWNQSLAEQLMGTQVEINKLLMTISASINLVGVPRVFVEDGSKVVKAHLNNQVGSIVTYQGTKPSYEIAPCMPQEVYAQLERLVQYAYQQSGISTLSATAQKPAGLNSGEAIRNYDDLQSDRFAALVKRYDRVFIDLAYQILTEAREICDDAGKYQTVYPNKDGTKQIDLPKLDPEKSPFVIQCFDASSLPRDPSGRLEKIAEMMQAGLVSPQEGRRLLDYPDIEQVDKLENASEERILQILDRIVDTGTYTPPDPFMDLLLAEKLCTQYYNLYVAAKLEESKAQSLRTFFKQIQDLKLEASGGAMPGMDAGGGAPMPPGQDPNAPLAVPGAPPVSDLLPNVPA